jgi:hypothetical protein
MIFIAGCAGTATQPHEHTPQTKHYEESMFQVTKNGLYSVEMVIKDKELTAGVNSVDIIIHNKYDKDVIGANVTVTPWMPEMGHGVFEDPVITERGGGLYTVENIILIMSGHWELKINIKSDEIENGETSKWEDDIVFDFPGVKVAGEHDHKIMHAPAPSDLDLSATRMSDNGGFKVSYMSDINPLPVNKIHGWTLTVVTSDGKPVKDAVISIDGDMPEHGHGLPTEPEVTQELRDGVYLVEGMKFSMPGWWTMKFIIQTRFNEESVTFNLLLKE